MRPAARIGEANSANPVRAAVGLRPSVILVREWEQQMSGSGCCGRLGGDVLTANGTPIFAERRAIMEALGPLYLAIRGEFGDRVDVLVVDPRNLVSLLPRLLRDIWRFRAGLGPALHTLGSISIPSVIVNGRIFARGGWPEVGATLRHLRRLERDGGTGDVVLG